MEYKFEPRQKPSIIVSDTDQRRLTTLATDALERFPEVAEELLSEMERADVVTAEAIPPNVVQMGTDVVFQSDNGETRRVRLVFPGQADIAAGRISILTPIGAALIGLSEGQSIAWKTRDGRWRHLTILAVEGMACHRDHPRSGSSAQDRSQSRSG
jgi:regulator of nucleoside diphosphate kinase